MVSCPPISARWVVLDSCLALFIFHGEYFSSRSSHGHASHQIFAISLSTPNYLVFVEEKKS
jgi:hypothetical protein